MTQKEKVKVYDKFVEELKSKFKDFQVIIYSKNDLEKFFPELQESEDEKIRKSLIYYLQGLGEFDYPDKETYYNWLAWLEKQKTIDVLDKEEREFADNVDSYRKDMDEFYKKGYNAGREAEKQYWLNGSTIPDSERQDEQKVPVNDFKAKDWYVSEVDGKIRNIYHSVDKVEPKFHEGDWAVSNLDGNARRISEVHFDEYNSYYVVEGDSVNSEEYDRLHHLWAIDDAKDGDVIAFNDDTIVIFKDLYNKSTFHSYCYIEDGAFSVSEEDFPDWWRGEEFKPATEEQRDLLFSKMKEAGYKWNTEKKELEKIDNKELTDFESALFTAFNDAWQQYLSGEEVDVAQWAKEHSAELLKEAKQVPIAWSDKDEETIFKMMFTFRTRVFPSSEECISFIDFLKSLKDKVQPKQEWGEEDEQQVKV